MLVYVIIRPTNTVYAITLCYLLWLLFMYFMYYIMLQSVRCMISFSSPFIKENSNKQAFLLFFYQHLNFQLQVI